ncbi:hypothetical protein FB45DRAFT_213869 [Roridomyces roridus]|uniref:Uncharacterized protein n=1 Tax=Roridomyces roridus TaxID=1738132 RepID=A0AAD7BDD6_9AGAR|nr:hypothetical protein FB45DRAFT_213869 [Roridomyces roridus]
MQLDLKGTLRKIVQLLKSNDLDTAVCTAALRALSAFAKIADCVQPIVAVLPTIISIFKQTRYSDECRKEGTRLIQALATMESTQASIFPRLFSALTDEHVYLRVLGLAVLLEFIRPDTVDSISEHIQTMLALLEDPEQDVRIAAIHNAVALRALKPSLKKGAGEFQSTIHTEWCSVVEKLQDPAPRTYLVAWDNMPQLAHSSACYVMLQDH